MLGKYDRIDLVDLVYRDKIYPDTYLLTGDGIEPRALEVDLTGDLVFNEMEITNRKTACRLNDIQDLFDFLDAIDIYYKPYCPTPDTLLIGGEKDCLIQPDLTFSWVDEINACRKITSSRKFTRYPKYSVQASQKIVAYVTPEEDDAWNLLDAYYEREWGEIPYNESASQILITEFPWDYDVSQDGSSWSEGSGAVVLNLKDHEVSYRVFEDDMREKVIKYPSLEALVKDFIQPLHDGTLTDEDLKYRCEDYLL